MFQSLLQSQTGPPPIQLKRCRGLYDPSETAWPQVPYAKMGV